jgi:dynactin-4
MAKVNNGGAPKLTARDVRDRRKEYPEGPLVPDELVDADLQFSTLKSFYQTQLASHSSIGHSLQDGVGFSSPAALTRIMSLYTGRGNGGMMQQSSSELMREALNT